jgi:hypothetical protein
VAANQSGSANYNAAAQVTQNITVGKVGQAITFNVISAKTYGVTDFDPGATASSGLAVTYSSSNTAVAIIASGKIHVVGVGTSTITASQSGDASWQTAVSLQQVLTVNKATLTVSADKKDRAYNTANPELTYTLSGFVNGDTASVLSGSPTLTTTATTTSPVSNYPITIDTGTLATTNYIFIFVNGTLTVTISSGDLDGDGDVTLADLIIALQAMSSINPTAIRSDYILSGVDVNGDNKIGIQEAVYILQKIVGVR